MPRIMFGYHGSKGRMAQRIVSLFPPEGGRYVEPFAGRANVYFAVTQLLNYKKFWLNDTLTHLFLKGLQNFDTPIPVPNRGMHHRMREAKRNKQTYVDVPSLAKDIWPKKTPINLHVLEPLLCYSGGFYETSGRKSRAMKRISRKGFQNMVVRAASILRSTDTRITNWDYKKVLADCREGDMVFLDPPYRDADISSYRNHTVDHGELVELLRRAPYHWVLSEYEHEIYQPLGKPVLRIPTLVTMSNSHHTGGRRVKAVECLWSNVPCYNPAMNTLQLLARLQAEKAEIERKSAELDNAIRLIESHTGTSRAKAVSQKGVAAPANGQPKKKGRIMNEAERKRMSRAIKLSWVKRRAAAKKK